MSRNSSGTYTLPAGNPVVTGTVITSNWGNTTLQDIAAALTDSLSRTGQGSMQAGLRLADGTSSLPGLTWGTELTSGMYRAGAGDFRWVTGTVEMLRLTTSVFRVVPQIWLERDASNTDPNILLQNTRPNIQLWEDDAAANNGRWQWLASVEAFTGQAVSDDGLTGTNWIQVDRTGTTIDTVNFGNGTLQYGGIEVGYRGMRQRRDITASSSTLATDAGGVVNYGGGGGHTFTIDSNFGISQAVTVLTNGSSFNLTVAESLSGNIIWFSGAGFLTGSRTLASSGVMTIYMTGANDAWVWGVGIS